MGDPREALEQLRSLDRRLLALDGDLETRLETQFDIAVGPLGKTVRIPDAGEMARIEQELTDIRLTLAATAEAFGLASGDDLQVEVSTTDSVAAYEAIGKRVAHQRPRVRRAFEALRTKHPQLRDEADLADGTEYREPVPGAFQRSFGHRAAIAVVVVPLVLGLAYWAYAHDQNDMREAAAKICATPSPCDGDQMEVAFAEPVSYEGSRANRGLVLFRHDAACSREVEVYFHVNGSFRFRGSVDDPNEAERAGFLDERADWHNRHEIVSQVACDRVDEL
jgi:hypothetical protein